MSSTKVILLLIAFFCLSCSQEGRIIDKLSGQWEIREITHNGVNYKDDLYINFMAIENDKKILIPESVNFEKDYAASWTIDLRDQNKLKLLIHCQDTVFNGIYDLTFIKNSKEKLLGIEMKSNHTKITAFKFFQDFNSEKYDW